MSKKDPSGLKTDFLYRHKVVVFSTALLSGNLPPQKRASFTDSKKLSRAEDDVLARARDIQQKPFWIVCVTGSAYSVCYCAANISQVTLNFDTFSKLCFAMGHPSRSFGPTTAGPKATRTNNIKQLDSSNSLCSQCPNVLHSLWYVLQEFLGIERETNVDIGT